MFRFDDALPISFVARTLLAVGCSAPDSPLLADRPNAPMSVGDAAGVDAGNPAIDAAVADAALSADATTSFDQGALLWGIANQAYRTSPAYSKASVRYPSIAAVGSWVNEWVSFQALSDYQRVAPDGGGAPTTMPVGTVIVRAVEDATGAVTKLTLMCKGPPGFNPELGDWWFGVTDPNGVPLVNDAGVKQIGKLEGCYGCHVPHAGEDFLFGVPPADLARP